MTYAAIGLGPLRILSIRQCRQRKEGQRQRVAETHVNVSLMSDTRTQRASAAIYVRGWKGTRDSKKKNEARNLDGDCSVESEPIIDNSIDI